MYKRCDAGTILQNIYDKNINVIENIIRLNEKKTFKHLNRYRENNDKTAHRLGIEGNFHNLMNLCRLAQISYISIDTISTSKDNSGLCGQNS